jgi:hypothetical protein
MFWKYTDVYCTINMKGCGKGFKLSLIATNGEKRSTDIEAMEEHENIMSEVFHSHTDLHTGTYDISYFTYTKLRKLVQFTSFDARQKVFYLP